MTGFAVETLIAERPRTQRAANFSASWPLIYVRLPTYDCADKRDDLLSGDCPSFLPVLVAGSDVSGGLSDG
jgi:hypothetical protein